MINQIVAIKCSSKSNRLQKKNSLEKPLQEQLFRPWFGNAPELKN